MDSAFIAFIAVWMGAVFANKYIYQSNRSDPSEMEKLLKRIANDTKIASSTKNNPDLEETVRNVLKSKGLTLQNFHRRYIAVGTSSLRSILFFVGSLTAYYVTTDLNFLNIPYGLGVLIYTSLLALGIIFFIFCLFHTRYLSNASSRTEELFRVCLEGFNSNPAKEVAEKYNEKGVMSMVRISFYRTWRWIYG